MNSYQKRLLKRFKAREQIRIDRAVKIMRFEIGQNDFLTPGMTYNITGSIRDEKGWVNGGKPVLMQQFVYNPPEDVAFPKWSIEKPAVGGVKRETRDDPAKMSTKIRLSSYMLNPLPPPEPEEDNYQIDVDDVVWSEDTVWTKTDSAVLSGGKNG